MGSFQVYDALNILFKLEKPPTEHLEGFILLMKEGGELQFFFKNFKLEIRVQEFKKIPQVD
jgi:hypothetical protein